MELWSLPSLLVHYNHHREDPYFTQVTIGNYAVHYSAHSLRLVKYLGLVNLFRQ
jgi:hypothetical protein